MMNQDESIITEKTEIKNEVKKAQCPQCMYCDIFAKARTPRNLEWIYKEEEDTGCTVQFAIRVSVFGQFPFERKQRRLSLQRRPKLILKTKNNMCLPIH